MKKQLVASLAAAMVLGVAGTSFAATNPFSDVPAKHWSYDAVGSLAKAGIVDGYGDGTYKGDKMISRYEMAQIVAKAMAHSDKADASQKATIDKLSVEFASELEGLNVRVTKLEKNSSTVKVSGEARLRYEHYNHDLKKNPLTGDSSNSYKLRTRVNLDGQINDQWSYYGRLEANTDLQGDSKDRGTDSNVRMDNAYVKGQLFGTTATIGRFDYFLGNGLMIDSTLNGVNIGFGNVLKANAFYGKERNTNIFSTGDTHLEVTGLGLDYATSKATKLHGGYYQYKNTDNAAVFATGTDDSAKIWEAGFKTQFTPNWSLSGSYGQSDADAEDTAYYAELGYKGADKKKVGSYGAWVNYRHLEAQAAPATTTDGAYSGNAQLLGGKGYELGFNYTPALNTLLRVKYADLKSTTVSAADKTKFVQAQVEFFF
jgi:uncharacterized lipoprotein YehR (DUF1307 family)